MGGRERPENLTWCLAKKNDKVLSSYFSKFNPICWKTLFFFHRGLHGSWRIDRKSGPISCRPHRDTRPYWIYHRFVIPKNCNFFNQRKMSNIKFCLSCLSVVYTDVFSLIYVDPTPFNFFPLLPTKMDFQQIQQFLCLFETAPDSRFYRETGSGFLLLTLAHKLCCKNSWKLYRIKSGTSLKFSFFSRISCSFIIKI